MSADAEPTPYADPAAVARLAPVKRALEWCERERERVIAEAIRIAQIPSPTFEETERAAHVEERFRAVGLEDVERDTVGNVYGRRPGCAERPAIAFCAHTDTVFPRGTNVTVRRERDRAWGPGLGDNSLGVAGLLALAQALDAGGVKTEGPIWLIATVGEEGLGDLRGMRAAMERLAPRLDAAVALEGAGLGRIYHAGIGVRRLRVTFRAPGGHSWLHFGARSAVHELARFVAAVADLPVPAQPRTTYNVGVIEGGTSVNSIAQSASLLLDMRSEDVEALRALADRVDALIERARRTPDLTVEVEVVGDRPAGRIPVDHPLVRTCAAAGEVAGLAKLGLHLQYEAGSTDANIPLSLGLPAVCTGITTGGNNHRLDEFIDLEPIPVGLRQTLLLALAVAGVARG